MRSSPLPGAYPGATAIGAEEAAAARDVLERRSPFRHYGPDPAFATSALERQFAEHLGVAHCLGVSSGTAALVVALRALEVGPGDEVVLPPVTFIGCATAIVAAGAVPVFADVDDDLQIAPASIEAAITSRTKAIMVVHWRGVAVPLDPILDLARARSIPVIEDCAQSMGARDDGHDIGSRGRINAFSFQMNKVLTAGEGGMVATDDHTLALRAAALHDNGSTRTMASAGSPLATPELLGENYRLSDLAAAVLRVQIGKLERVRDHLRQISGTIAEAAVACPGVCAWAAAGAGGGQ